MVFLGAAVALRRSDHFIIDLIPRKVDQRFGRPLQILVLAAVFAISAILLIGGLAMAQGGLSRISTASGLHLTWAFAALPAGGLFMAVFAVELAVKVIRGRPPSDPDEPVAGGRAQPTDPPGAPRTRPHSTDPTSGEPANGENREGGR